MTSPTQTVQAFLDAFARHDADAALAEVSPQAAITVHPLGIGGRGLNPNRVTNFNTRQNGYDISADALGYPESYYSPTAEMIDRIEILRGASSLQYGTQFGGLINYKLKEGPTDKPFELTANETGGSWGFWNASTSVGGTNGKLQ